MRLILRTITSIAFLLLMLSTGAALPVTNGGFDSGLTGWTATVLPVGSSDEEFIPDTLGAISVDSGAAKLQILSYEQNIAIIRLSQDITFSSSTGTLSFDLNFAAGTVRDEYCTDTHFQATFGSDFLMAYNATGPYDESFNDITLESLAEEGWYRFTQVITGPGTLYFELYDDGGFYNTIVWVDNVVLTENINTVPEPSTILLLAAGLLGLISTGFRFVRR